MQSQISEAVEVIRASRKVLAISHIDADGISALSIVVKMLEREDKEVVWENIHQLNSETIIDVEELIKRNQEQLEKQKGCFYINKKVGSQFRQLNK